jgi:putative membrane protein
VHGVDEKEKLAEDRTNMAEDRTVLANERTFAGWLRTGFAAVGIGLGFHVLFQAMEPKWVPKAIATAFLLAGIYVIVVAERRACAVLDRLDTHKVTELRPMNLKIVTWVSVAATLALVAAIWLLKVDGGGTAAA